ncbi:hypothetical protein [Arcticibacter tournemirensis]
MGLSSVQTAVRSRASSVFLEEAREEDKAWSLSECLPLRTLSEAGAKRR